MQELSLDTEISLCPAIFSPITIGFISEYRATDGREMDAYLMGTARLDATHEETIFIANIRVNSTIVSDGFLSGRVDSDFCFVFCMLETQESSAYRITWLHWSAYHESMIDFLYAIVLEECEE
jgi:hypothetical protein